MNRYIWLLIPFLLLVSCEEGIIYDIENQENIRISNKNINDRIDFTKIKDKYTINPAIVSSEAKSGVFFINCSFDDTISGFHQFEDYVTIVTFDKPVGFYNCTFNAPIIFRQNRFFDDVSFIKCTFNDEVHFEGANFNGKNIDFRESIFHKGAFYTSASFSGDVNFMNAQFDSVAKFNNCKFGGKADFQVVNFKEKTDFSGIKVSSKIKFKYSKFRDKFILSNIIAKDDVILQNIVSDTVFECQNNNISGGLLMQKAKFKGKLIISNNNVQYLDFTDLDFNEAKLTMDNNSEWSRLPVRSL